MAFHWRPAAWCVLAATVATLAAARPRADGAWTWELPAGVPPPMVPADNPMSAGKVQLGRHLFYDTRLSGNGVQSCATCHQQARAFADMHPRSIGSTGDRHPRGSMSLVNIAYARALTWANSRLTRLEDQALVPMFSTHPVELGLDAADTWLDRLRGDAAYTPLFRAAFPDDPAITRTSVVRALAAFQRSIVSMRAPYDRYRFGGDATAIPAAARRGEALFQSAALGCATCHGGVHFSGTMDAAAAGEIELHNTGLYNLAGALSYPADNPGLYEVTRRPGDVGKFKAPTLRNIAVTAPYMHDGTVVSLDEAIDHYAAGGRTIGDGPHRGVGRDNPNKSAAIRGFALTAAQRADLLAFLHSLTDEEVLRDPRFSNPWPGR